MASLDKTRGYIPDPESNIDLGNYLNKKQCKFDYDVYEGDMFGRGAMSYVERTYSAFAELARKHRIKLMIVHQVIPCSFGTGKHSEKMREAIQRFRAEYPEVSVPFDLIATWPEAKFAVPAHVRDAHTVELSQRLGVAVGKIYVNDVR